MMPHPTRTTPIFIAFVLAALWSVGAHAAEKRLRHGSQVGITRVAYTESPGIARLDQTTIHFKENLDFWLIRDRLDLGLSGYISGLANLNASGDAASQAPLYWGTSLRASLSLSRKASSWDFRISPGYYIWGMSVKGQDYGIGALGAPQLVVAVRRKKSGNRPWGVYLKVAPTSASSDLLNTNRELAIGGDFSLTKAQAKRPLHATLDISHTNFQKGSAGGETQAAELLSLSAGISVRW